MSLFLILDDTSNNITYGPSPWNTVSHFQWYNSSTVVFDVKANANASANLKVSFHGTSIAFHGNTPKLGSSQIISVQIDNNSPYLTSYDDPLPQSYRQWYQSPELSDSEHNITITQIDGTSLDFVVIEVGQNTPLSGQKIIVDDGDPAILYSEHWDISGDHFGVDSRLRTFPFQNTTHTSSTYGATMSFKFAGTSVSINGMFDWSKLSSSSATYVIDDGPPVFRNYDVTSLDGSGGVDHFLFFSAESLSPDIHTLVMNVSQAVNQSIMLDYIIYTPYFESLSTMPSFNWTKFTSSTLTQQFPPPTQTKTTTSAIPGSPSRHTPLGAIIGGILGTIVLVTAIILSIFIRQRKRALPPMTQNVVATQSQFQGLGGSSTASINVTPFSINDILLSPANGGRKYRNYSDPISQADNIIQRSYNPTPAPPAYHPRAYTTP